MSEDAARPRIVVTVSNPAASSDPELARRKAALYADAVARSGGDPVVVDPTLPAPDRDRLLGEMAGLLITGGADVDPSLYGGTARPSQELDRDRDRLDRAAWEAAQKRSIPVLGICRGLQAINVFAGGKVVADVPDHVGVAYGSGPAATHDMEIDGDSRLGRAVAQVSSEGLASTDEDDNSIELTVNTYHHQAVDHDTLAPGLRAVGWARSNEGRLVEAFETRGPQWVVGIQCHPERTESTPDELCGLFDAFVRAAAEAEVEPIA